MKAGRHFSATDAIIKLALLATASLLCWVWASYGHYLWQALHYPYGLDYSEGLIWQQVVWLGGPQMYGDISHYPFVVFVYPPLYLATVKAIAAAGVGMLPAGRGVSIVATLTMCCLLGLITWRACSLTVRPLAAWLAAILAALLPGVLLPIISWSVLMRVDMLALALTYIGVVFGIYALRQPQLLHLAVLAFIAAVFTKQIYLAAPLSLAAVMVLRSPAVTLRAYGTGAILGVTLVAALSWMTGGGFIRHVFLYNVDRVQVGVALKSTALWLAAYPILAGLVALAVAVVWRRILTQHKIAGLGDLVAVIRADEWAAFILFMTIYLAMTTCMLISAGKTGASRNYFLEWMSVWCIWIGLLAACVANTSDSLERRRRALSAAMKVAIPALLCMQIAYLPKAIDLLRASQFSPKHRAQAEALLARVKNLPGPIMSDDMVLIMQSSHEVGIEPGIMLELAGTGLWDESKLIAMLKTHRFSAIVTAYDPGDPTFDARYLPATQTAMLADYPVVEQFGDYRLRSPR